MARTHLVTMIFPRLAGRLQVTTRRGTTDLFTGYHSKLFGESNLYTPFGFNEADYSGVVLTWAGSRRPTGS